MTYLIKGNLLWPDGQIRPGILTLDGAEISGVYDDEQDIPENGRSIINIPQDGVVAPGFIDLQINGAFGHDFTATPQQIVAVARNLPRFGVTAFLPTLISAPLEHYAAAVEIVRQIRHESEMALVLGLHIEGPYLNRAKAGSHPVYLLRRPELEELVYFNEEWVRLVTLAPELPGAFAFIRALCAKGIHVGLGHSMANYEVTLAAADAGARWGAHIFNAMETLHHRHPGIIGALLADDRLCLGMIADNTHLHPAVLRMVATAKGPGGVALVSDAVAAAGMPTGRYTLGSQTVNADSNAVRLANGTLAGSVVMLDQAVRNMVFLAERPLADVLQMASQTPASVLGEDRKGRLCTGCDADLVVLDGQLQVAATFVAGDLVYKRNE